MVGFLVSLRESHKECDLVAMTAERLGYELAVMTDFCLAD